MRKLRTSMLVATVLLAASCVFGGGGDAEEAASTTPGGLVDPGNCVTVDAAVSPEKIDLLTELARRYNDAKPEVEGRCVVVRPFRKASGAGMSALAQGWAGETDPQPTIWSPASTAWGKVLDQRLAAAGRPAMAGAGTPFMQTPLVIAMPRPMAEALGWPQKPIGWADVLELARSPEGWAKHGHPEWGPFRLGKTNPNFSTSGLSALIAQAYAATGKTSGLSQEDLNRPDVDAFARGVESAVVHYGDTTLTFLNNWARADQRGTALSYVSAAAVEEKSVIDYNAGNPDGVLDPGEAPRAPRMPLVAVYPKEGTLFSDNPLFVLDASWVSAEQKNAARSFVEFVLRAENQEKVLQFGFRPGNPSVRISAPIEAGNGVDPSQPQTQLQTPEPAVLARLLSQWDAQRKSARVLLVLDVSGSMGDPAEASGRDTKLDLAQRAAVTALDLFGEADEVGLRVFSTNLDGRGAAYLDLAPIARVGDQREGLKAKIGQLTPRAGTPLYTVAQASVDDMLAGYAAERINAVVLLTDGVNEDGNTADDREQLTRLLTTLRQATEGETGRPVRLFTIGYGAKADSGVLISIAEATNARYYDSTNPRSIDQVFANVVSNF